MNKKNLTCKSLILILILSVITLSIRTKLAYADANIYIDPSVNGPVEPGGTFSINIFATGIPSQGGPPPGANLWQIYISFDSTMVVIQNPATDIVEGDWASSLGYSTSGISYHANTPGDYLIGEYITSNNAITGDAFLASIMFTVMGPGNCTLHLHDTKLSDVNGVTIPSTSTDATFFTDTPKASFTYSYMNSTLRTPIVGETITFNATYDPTLHRGSYDPEPGGSITNYAWDFGDGNTTSGQYPLIKHAFAATGEYSSKLTVTDNTGLTNSQTAVPAIHVARRDIAITDLKITPVVALPGAMVSINVTVTNLGTETEYFNVTLTYNATLIPPTLIVYNLTRMESDYCLALELGPDNRPPAPSLLPGKSIVIAYEWNTTGLPEQEYTIKADAELIPNERMYQEFFVGIESNYDNNVRQGLAFITSQPINIAVSTIKVAPTVIAIGHGPVSINVTVQNQGNVDETFSVAVFYNSTLIENRTGVTLSPYTNTTLVYSWSTQSLSNATYSIMANASSVPGEFVLTDNNLTYSGNVIISYPPIANFTYTPAPIRAGESVLFNATVSRDPDGTIESYTWNFGDGTPSQIGVTTQHTYAHAGTYDFNLTVMDNVNLNTTIAEQLTVAKALSQISIAISPTTLTYGNSATITGNITPEIQANVTLQYRVQGQTTWTDLATKKSNATGYYSQTWTPPGAKTYQVNASWPGDADTLSSFSLANVTVNKAASTITIFLSSQSVSVGSSITITGKITPQISGVTVAIMLQAANGTQIQIGAPVTNSSGGYLFTWITTEKGTFQVKAVRNADDNVNSGQSDSISVTVTEAPSEGIPLMYYIAVAAVIVIIIVVALVYFLKIRKH